MGLVGIDPQVMKADLGLGPGQGQTPFEGGGVGELVDQVEGRLPLAGDHGREVEVGAGSGLDSHLSPQAENRIEDPADRVR